MTSASLPAQASQAALARQGTAWQWRAEAGDESIIGTVAHAWLERIGKEGADAWSSDRVDACLPVFSRPLGRSGLAKGTLSDAATVLPEAMTAHLARPKGQR